MSNQTKDDFQIRKKKTNFGKLFSCGILVQKKQ